MRVTKSKAVERVGMKKHFLLCLLFFSSSVLANPSLKEKSNMGSELPVKLNELELRPILLQMTEENRSASPNDGIRERLVRNIAICLEQPVNFYGSREFREHKKLLMNYIRKKPLTFDGDSLRTHIDGNQIRRAYFASQERQIDDYIDSVRSNPHHIYAKGSCWLLTSLTLPRYLKDLNDMCGSMSTYFLVALCIIPSATCLNCCET